jgi:two-component system sensor histidine kinase/response regulator
METKNPLILIVEDEAAIRNQLEEALPRMGYDVIVSPDGFDALARLESFQPDMILSDIKMPGLSGIELKKELSRSDRLASIPFVFVSALSGMHHIREGMEMAADDYLTKPFRLRDLKAVIDAQLEKARARVRYQEKSMQVLAESLQLIFPHEIITPITVIHGFADFLKSLDMGSPSDQKLMIEMLDGILESSQRLRELTDKFTVSVKSNLRKLQTNQELLEEQFTYDVRHLVTHVAERTARGLNGAHRMLFDVEAEQILIAKEVLDRILTELVKNALQYSPDEASVQITGRRSGSSYVLSVCDKGPGMPPEQIAGIGFFTQFERKSKEQQGLGLGLALAKRMVSLVGGKLSFEPCEPNGLRVEIRIPLPESNQSILN